MGDDRSVAEPSSTGETKRLSLGRLIAFALPAVPAAAIDTPLSVYAPPFYAGQMGLGLGLVGQLFFISGIAEILIGMGAGAISDRWGGVVRRRRFWMVLATPIVVLAIWRLFAPPANVDGAYLLIWMLVLIVGAVLLQVNHTAWGSEITADYHERTRVQGARQMFGVAGLVLILVAPVLIERAHLGDPERLRMNSVAWFTLLVMPAAVALAVFLAPERRSATTQPPPRRVGEALRAMARSHPLRMLLLIDLLDAAALGVVTRMFVFLSDDVWGLGRVTSIMLLCYLVSGLICLGPILRLARGRSKHRAAAMIALCLTAALPLIALVPHGGTGWAIACMVLLGAPSAVNSALFDSMMGDVAAFDAAAGGARVRTGLFYSLHIIMGRLGRALAIAVCYAILDRIGFHTHMTNAPGVLTGFKLLYVVPPMLLQLAMAALLWRFPLDQAAHDAARVSAQQGQTAV